MHTDHEETRRMDFHLYSPESPSNKKEEIKEMKFNLFSPESPITNQIAFNLYSPDAKPKQEI